jgi:hypothetical protein
MHSITTFPLICTDTHSVAHIDHDEAAWLLEQNAFTIQSLRDYYKINTAKLRVALEGGMFAGCSKRQKLMLLMRLASSCEGRCNSILLQHLEPFLGDMDGTENDMDVLGMLSNGFEENWYRGAESFLVPLLGRFKKAGSTPHLLSFLKRCINSLRVLEGVGAIGEGDAVAWKHLRRSVAAALEDRARHSRR